MRSGGGFKISVGTSSLLTIFVILALTIFSVLGYVTANSDYKLANRTAQGITDYYAADTKAESFLEKLDRALYLYMKEVQEMEETGMASDVFTGETAQELALLRQNLSGGAFYREAYGVVLGSFLELSGQLQLDFDGAVQSEKLLTVEFTVDDSRKLIMEVQLNDDPFGESARYQVVKRSLVSTMEYGEELLIS